MVEIIVIAADEAAAVRCADDLAVAQTQGRVVIASAAGAAPTGPGVFTVDQPPAPADLAGLSTAERLFVDAWRLRVDGGPPKKRPGDGLTWDMPGFEPPDPTYPHDR